MNQTTFSIKGDSIQLIKLLKATGIADSGADAKDLVDNKKVSVNGVVELRKRAQLIVGDVVSVGEHSILVQ